MHLRILFWSLLIFAAIPSLAKTGDERVAPFTYSNGLIWIKITASGNEQPFDFLLDSGAGATVISFQAARQLHLKLGQSQVAHGVQGPCAAARAKGFIAHFAGIPLPSDPLAIDLESVSTACHRPIDGLLGADFFRGQVVQIDFAARQIRISKSVPLAKGRAPLPLEPRNDAMCVRAKIAGRAGQLMRVDTGYDGALEWFSPAAKMNTILHGTSVGLSRGQGPSALNDLQIGAQHFDAVKTGMHAQEIFPGEAGLLGNALLSKFNVTLDFGQRRLFLEPL